MEFNSLNNKERKIRVIAYWVIWYNQNKIYHEGAREQVNEVVSFVKAYCLEITAMEVTMRSVQVVGNYDWSPPGNDTIKINFDATFNQHTRRSNSGVIARNKDGLVMAACTFLWAYISGPVMAEARACLQVVSMAEEMGFHDICIKGDSLTIIRKLNTAEEDKSEISSLVKEIKGRAYIFRSVRFRHIPREANKAAHGMAMEGHRYENPQYWIEEVPQAVEGLVNSERRGNGEEG
ncbi:hypothetical protein CXB51_028103 [Gossypium anomalum]|uniref:RNase H type-1 domain-containing protein n=1 Tax=Gossypium anomalum TaxID=47600 RepID=A0A8J5YE20_9ROSI|nr:hypothetical protein CXB51_028103 [Gossypium anomalum]